MREFIVELLHRERGAWSVSAVDSVSDLDRTASSHPDLVIVDTADFATCCGELPATFTLARVVVIGPEPDIAYRQDALHRGAGAWLSRDCVAEELCDALRSTLARHVSCAHFYLRSLPVPSFTIRTGNRSTIDEQALARPRETKWPGATGGYESSGVVGSRQDLSSVRADLPARQFHLTARIARPALWSPLRLGWVGGPGDIRVVEAGLEFAARLRSRTRAAGSPYFPAA